MLKSMQAQAGRASSDQLSAEIQKTVEQATAAAERAAEQAAKAAADQRETVIHVPPYREEIPPQVENISIAFFVMTGAVIIGLPLMRAFARRIERGTPQPAKIPDEMKQQLQQLSASVEAIAIEVERISEGQRFTTKMLAERSREGTSA